MLLLGESKAAKRIPSDPAFTLGSGELFYELPQHEEEGLVFLGIADELERDFRRRSGSDELLQDGPDMCICMQ